MSTPQTCNRCGRTYGVGSDEKRRHQMLNGHAPSPEKPAAPAVDLDEYVREMEQGARGRRKGGAA
ncbi:hypothetical protein [Isoptericola sp. NPDC056134]|uniref:hypothetical protein n=1 Tax=Isoptericola sp. NPDC056134 TaxID=3345723 RepID=UPI0035EF76D9